MNLGILISGRGSNMQAIHRAILSGELPAKIKLIISDQEKAAGLKYAAEQGLAHELIKKNSGENKSDYDKRLVDTLKKAQVDTVALAGFMKIITPYFLKNFSDRVLNIHPSLLPSFPGLHAQEQALKAGVRYSGCTVHFVDEDCDTGPIIDQKVVKVLASDTVETLSQRILAEEHALYSQVLKKLAQGKVLKKGRKVFLQD